ncbi:MAG: 5'-nucleotidase [Kineosporiaceae bacterium]
MGYSLEHRLVIGIASSALFDLSESDAVFKKEGEDAYRQYQERHLSRMLEPGVAFPFIRRILSLNDLSEEGNPLVEVIIMSRNDPDTGLRVMRSIAAHSLPMSRAIFTQGQAPYHFMRPLNMSLFLSADDADVREAVTAGLPAGRVMDSKVTDESEDRQLRIAFDFDGVLADDSSETIFRSEGIDGFRNHEEVNVARPHNPGPLRDFLAGVNRIQRIELEQRAQDPAYGPRLRVSLITARNAPAHERAVTSLKAWGVTVNDAFFLGGIDKGLITEQLRPHIFFDDQTSHLDGTARSIPRVHVPFGIANEPMAASDHDAGVVVLTEAETVGADAQAASSAPN